MDSQRKMIYWRIDYWNYFQANWSIGSSFMSEGAARSLHQPGLSRVVKITMEILPDYPIDPLAPADN